MKNTMAIVVLAASLIVSCGLLSVMITMYVQVKNVSSAQQKELASMQDEYDNADVIALNGQVVEPAEAVSLVRKYENLLTIKLNGASVAAGTLTRASFHDQRWKVEAKDSTGNGACDVISFTAVNRNNNTPGTLQDAMEQLKLRLGNTSDTTWANIYERIDELQSATDWKTRIAALIGSDETGTWDDIYRDLIDYTDQAGSGAHTVPFEKVTIPANSVKQFSMLAPVRGIAVCPDGKTATLEFSLTACEVKGELRDKLVCDPSGRSITNYHTDKVDVYLYSD